MANSVSITALVNYLIDGQNTPQTLLQRNGLTIQLANDGLASAIQVIGISAENLSVGAITAAGFAVLLNLDDTNFVQIGWDDSGFEPAFKLGPGHPAILTLDDSRVWQAKANAAPVNLLFAIAEAD